MDADWCLPLTRLSAADLAVAGGKGANLGELVAAGLPVPPGFVVTTAAFRLAVADLASPDRDAVLAVDIPPPVRGAVLAAYAELGGGQVAVRSSATAEDLPGAAFAGQQDTVLAVLGDGALLDAVRRCWASLWTERAIAYRARLGVDPSGLALAVVVQRMVAADHAGVMFTANPVSGARDEVIIDSNPGLGEAVVAGLVTPDHAVLDAANRVVERRAGRRETVIRAVEGGGTRQGAAGDVAPVGEPDLRRLAGLGRRITAHFGRPQDIEWAIAGGEISVLQARPMTALPPAPIPLSRFQRFFGPIVLELLPRRPYPLELGAWITRNVGRHLEGLFDRIAGVRVVVADMLPVEDGVVQSLVPPEPRPTRRTPFRLARTLWRLRRDPSAWTDDPRHARFVAQATRLAGTDFGRVGWAELLAIPDRVAAAGDGITDLRAEYIPAAAGAMARLRLLLGLLGQGSLFGELVLEVRTTTQEANAELVELSRQLRRLAPPQDLDGADGASLLNLVESDPAAAPVRARLEAFLARYGHRETGSVLLLGDPTWSDAPEIVMSLVAVLLDEPDAQRPGPAGVPSALDRLLAHRVVRATRSERRVRRLVTRAAAAVVTREDTHFEFTRTMPPVRAALVEAGRRLAAAGGLDDPEDVWYLTWAELSGLDDPRDSPPDPLIRPAARRRRAAYAELAAAPLIATTTLYPDRSRAGAEDALASGVGGGGGRATGPVRIIRGPEEFATLRSGEVLVCVATNPSWTPLFARAAAVVVDNGGLASHAAIVAREYQIPAVMGSGNGTSVLLPGTQVLVDGDRGLVLAADGGDGGDGTAD